MTRIALVLVAAAAAASLAEAQTPTFERLVLRLDQGDRITVTDVAGRELEGRLIGLSASTLSVRAGGGRHDLNPGDVSIIQRRKRDSVREGAVRGLLIGTGLAVALAQPGYRTHPRALLSAALFGGIGAGIGAGFDALREDSTVVYRVYGARASGRRFAVSPFSRGNPGLSVSLGF